MARKKDDFTLRDQLSNTIYAVKFMYRANKGLYFIRIPMLIVQTISTILPVIFMKMIIDELAIGKDMIRAVLIAAGMALTIFACSMLGKLMGVYDAKQRQKTAYGIKRELATASMRMNYSAVENPEMKDYIWLAQANKFEVILDYLTGFIGAFFNVIGMSAVIISMKPLVLIIILVSAVIRMLIDKKMRTIPYYFNEKKTPTERRLNYYKRVMKEAEYGKEVRVNNLEDWIFDKYKHGWKEDYFPIYKSYTRKMKKYDGIVESISFIQDGLVYLILAFNVVFRAMTIGDFSMYLTGSTTFSDSLLGMAGCYSNLMGHSWFVMKYRECINIAEKLKSESGNTHLEDTTKVRIEFKNVSFKYPNTERLILKNINLTLEPGETLSIVGVNGAGKTTFVKLLCRLYEPTEGEILINGIPSNDIPLDEYYDLLSVVFQDFKLFSFTVHENITMNTEYDVAKLNESISKSGLNEKVSGLPEGINTMLFKEFDEKGIEFSGGEGQKIAIARALYQSSPIVIFDEPTSALDPIAEYEIYRNFDNLAKGRSAIYVSHRLSATRFTDKIAVFSAGELAEYGTHKELIAKNNGIYKSMFEMQAQYYM